jgi:hypothetical protein
MLVDPDTIARRRHARAERPLRRADPGYQDLGRAAGRGFLRGCAWWVVCWVVVGGWLSSARYCAALRAVPRYELSLALVVACRRGRPWLAALVGRSPSAFAALRPAAGARVGWVVDGCVAARAAAGARGVGGARTRVGGWRVGLAVALGPGHAVGGHSSAPASLLAMAVAPLVVTKRRPPAEHSDHHQPVGDTLQLRVDLTSGRARCRISHGASGPRPFLRQDFASGEVGAIQFRRMDPEGKSCSSIVSGGS